MLLEKKREQEELNTLIKDIEKTLGRVEDPHKSIVGGMSCFSEQLKKAREYLKKVADGKERYDLKKMGEIKELLESADYAVKKLNKDALQFQLKYNEWVERGLVPGGQKIKKPAENLGRETARAMREITELLGVESGLAPAELMEKMNEEEKKRQAMVSVPTKAEKTKVPPPSYTQNWGDRPTAAQIQDYEKNKMEQVFNDLLDYAAKYEMRYAGKGGPEVSAAIQEYVKRKREAYSKLRSDGERANFYRGVITAAELKFMEEMGSAYILVVSSGSADAETLFKDKYAEYINKKARWDEDSAKLAEVLFDGSCARYGEAGAFVREYAKNKGKSTLEASSVLASTVRSYYGMITNAISVATTPEAYETALRTYRAEFGNNDFLFNQIIDFGTIKKALLIDSPEELGAWLRQNEEYLKTVRTSYLEFYHAYESVSRIKPSKEATAQRIEDTGKVLLEIQESAKIIGSKITVFDAYLLRVAGIEMRSAGLASRENLAGVFKTLLTIYQRDQYLAPSFLSNVVPAFCEVVTDEKDFQKKMALFNAHLTNKLPPYGASMALREYMKGRFEEIANALPAIPFTFSHGTIFAENWDRRLFEHPEYYSVKPHFFIRNPNRSSIPTYIEGQYSLSLGARGVGTINRPSGFSYDLPSILPGAGAEHDYLYDQLHRGADRRFKVGIPGRFRLGEADPYAVDYLLNKIFAAPMSQTYSGEVVGGKAELAAYGGEKEGRTEFEVGGRGGYRTPTGGGEAEIRGGREGETDKVGHRIVGGGVPGVASGERSLASALPVPTFGLGENIHTFAVQGDYREDAFTREMLKTYQELAREKGDMLLFFYGNWEPTDSAEELENKQLRGQLYYLTKDGDVYRLAYSHDTEQWFLNYLFGEADTKNVLASIKTIGDGFTDDVVSKVQGAALGFTLGRFAMGALGQAVKRYNPERTMAEPIAIEESVGVGWTGLLEDLKERSDVLMGIYRGARRVEQRISLTPEGEEKVKDKIIGGEAGTYSGEIIYRNLGKDDRPKYEIRILGGWPTTVGAQLMSENVLFKGGFGVGGGYAEDNLQRTYDALNEAEQVMKKTKQWLVSAYGWQEDKAEKEGWLAALTFIGAKTSQTLQTMPTEDDKEKYYWMGLGIYFAGKFNLVAGLEHSPKSLSTINDIMDRALAEAQQNPHLQKEIFDRAAEEIKQILKSDDRYKYALGIGYDGKLYLVSSSDFETYGSLFGLFFLNRDAYLEAIGNAYYGGYRPYADLAIGATFPLRKPGIPHMSITVPEKSISVFRLKEIVEARKEEILENWKIPYDKAEDWSVTLSEGATTSSPSQGLVLYIDPKSRTLNILTAEEASVVLGEKIPIEVKSVGEKTEVTFRSIYENPNVLTRARIMAGPTVELPLGHVEEGIVTRKGPYGGRGFSVQALIQLFESYKHSVIFGGVYGKKYLDEAELEQWQVVLTGQHKEVYVTESEITSWYVLFDSKNHKIYIGPENEIKKLKEWSLTAGVEYAKIDIKGEGDSLKLVLNIGRYDGEMYGGGGVAFSHKGPRYDVEVGALGQAGPAPYYPIDIFNPQFLPLQYDPFRLPRGWAAVVYFSFSF